MKNYFHCAIILYFWYFTVDISSQQDPNSWKHKDPIFFILEDKCFEDHK